MPILPKAVDLLQNKIEFKNSRSVLKGYNFIRLELSNVLLTRKLPTGGCKITEIQYD